MRVEARLMLRLPADAKLFLEAQSERNCTSQNSEIIRCIRERMERETKTATTEPARAE